MSQNVTIGQNAVVGAGATVIECSGLYYSLLVILLGRFRKAIYDVGFTIFVLAILYI